MPVRRATDVPPKGEVIVELIPLSRVKERAHPRMVEPLSSFPAETALVMSRTLTTLERRSVKVAVMNPDDVPMTLNRGHIVATATPIDSVIDALPDNTVSVQCRATTDSDTRRSTFSSDDDNSSDGRSTHT